MTVAPDHGGAIRRTLIAIGLRLLPAWDELLMRFSDAKEHQVFPNDLFLWPTFLEQNWEAIRAERNSYTVCTAFPILHSCLGGSAVR